MPQSANHPVLPVLPLRDVVVFPHMVIPLFVGREKSITALEQAMAADKRIVLLAFLLLIFFAEFSGLLGQAVSGKRRYEGPLGGKTDRATLIGLFTGACAFVPAWWQYNPYFISLVCVFVLLTAINRLRVTVAEASKTGAKP